MYFTDCKVIDQAEDIDVQKFKGHKAIGFLSITSEEWKSEIGPSRLRFLEQYLISKDDCFFYVSTNVDVRSKFISIMQQCNHDFAVADGQDFIAYYCADDINFGETDIRLTLLPPTIDGALKEIEEVVGNVKRGIVIAKIKVAVFNKTGMFLFEILKKIIMA